MLRPRRNHHDVTPDERVASLLQAAAAPTEVGAVPGEVEALAAFRESRAESEEVFVPRRSTTVATVVLATVGAGILVTGGVAAAAGGNLPGPAQNTARDLLDVVGFEVPGRDHRATQDQGGDSGDAARTGGGRAEQDGGATATDQGASAGTEGAGKGAERFEPAGRRELHDRRSHREGQGDEVSRSASQSRSHAGERDRGERERSYGEAPHQREGGARWDSERAEADRDREHAKADRDREQAKADRKSGWARVQGETAAWEDEQGEMRWEGERRTSEREMEHEEAHQRRARSRFQGPERRPRAGETERAERDPGGGTADPEGGTTGESDIGTASDPDGGTAGDPGGDAGEEGTEESETPSSGRGAGGSVDRR